jgi:Family of unknown function (DUF6527)
MNLQINLMRAIWQKLLGQIFKYKVAWVEDFPDELHNKTVYIAGENGHLWYVAMVCPCGCKEILQMGLMEGQRPKWSVTVHDNDTVSLHPSVWRKVGCKSHFWLRKGRISWCRNDFSY